MTTKTTRKKVSSTKKANRQAEMEALHEKLAQSVEDLRTSSRWTAYLDAVRSFHSYSASNLLLILIQMPEAAQVAGYRAWQDKGRQVRKGEKSIRILGTGTVKVTKDDEDEAGEDTETPGRRRIFFPVSVFDVSQTDPIEGTEDVLTVAQPLQGEDVHGIYSRVVDYLTAQGVTVERQHLTSANGYAAPANEETGEGVRVVIGDDLSPAQAAKTALHEAAHITLGHLDEFEEYATHRGRFEVEAESVAYVTAGLLGLDASDYSTGYVAGWATSAESDVIKSTAARVLATVHTLADALTQEEEDDAQGEAAA